MDRIRPVDETTAGEIKLARIMHGPRKMDEKPIYSMH